MDPPRGRPAYSVVEAEDMDAAVEIMRDQPFVGRGGKLQVTAAVSP
jgi:hypothetical protein